MKVKVISPFFGDRLFEVGEIIEAKEPVLGLTEPFEGEVEEPKTEDKPKKRTTKSKS